MLQRIELLDSILLSSPVFYKRLILFIQNDNTNIPLEESNRIEETLYKYIVRSACRATPFATFASISSFKVNVCPSVNTNKKHIIKSDLEVRVRLDLMAYNQITNRLKDEIISIPGIKVCRNKTMYRIGNDYRYVEKVKEKNEIEYQLSKFSHSKIIEQTLNFTSTPRTIAELIEFISGNGFELNEVSSFINELIDSTILITEFDSFLEPDNILKHLQRIQQLEQGINDKSTNTLLTDTLKLQTQLCKPELKIKNKLNVSEAFFKKNKIKLKVENMVHVDSKHSIENNHIDLNSQSMDDLRLLLKWLSSINKRTNDSYKPFKIKYEEQYGNESRPLLEVLDPDIGIGFENSNNLGVDSEPIKGLKFQSVDSNIHNHLTLGERELFLYKYLTTKKESKEVTLKFNDNFEDSLDHDGNLPATINAMVSVYGPKNSILFRSFTGSAINILSRFNYLDESILSLTKELAIEEKQIHKGRNISEILHLPELKSGNIILHHRLREKVIPLVVYSDGLLDEISLEDINIGIGNDEKIKLFHRDTGKEIMPIVSNTLNYNRNSIPLFKFLCGLRIQYEQEAFEFSWGTLTELFDHFPRVHFRSLIISPRFWKVVKSEFSSLKIEEINFKVWRQNRGIDRYVFLSSEPNDELKLLIDFDNIIAIRVFWKELNRHSKIYLSEDLIGEQTNIINDMGESHSNELIIPIVTNSISRSINHKSNERNKDNQDTCYYPGMKWLYIKVYMSVRFVQIFIEKALPLIAQNLKKEKLISKFHFVRYSDPDSHVRVRFCLIKSDDYLNVHQIFREHLFKEIDHKAIFNLIIDTYKPEFSRYGGELGVEECELLFDSDSFTTCQYYLSRRSENEFIFGCISIDRLLDDFGYHLNEKANMVTTLSDAYLREFNPTKETLNQLSKKYRGYRNELFTAMKSGLEESEYKAYHQLFDIRSQNNITPIKRLKNLTLSKPEIKEIVFSLIHMSLNRLFLSDQRAHELVLYYVLRKQYKSMLAIKKNL